MNANVNAMPNSYARTSGMTELILRTVIWVMRISHTILIHYQIQLINSVSPNGNVINPFAKKL
ncbi:hypothetical protein Smp_041320 [Schistosoma mansoni]|uniref:Uncharacterized protein n=1 Tax=Schistosoma mansoni TaxID=6183 RepID=G4V7E7_SCHMA|nr:hypothetical protein Smp_041320 [Schistosoma mansoni]|eukprot:XP_018648816.1 hypothetical protein Smp_041320 [Schistosoma mansoni]